MCVHALKANEKSGRGKTKCFFMPLDPLLGTACHTRHSLVPQNPCSGDRVKQGQPHVIQQPEAERHKDRPSTATNPHKSALSSLAPP